MELNVILNNSSEFHLNNDELFLRSIPAKLKVGELSIDSLRLLVYYITKASPYELALVTGHFEGTLEEWLRSLQATLTFKVTVQTYSELATVTEINQGELAFVIESGKVYPYSGESFPPEDAGLTITGESAYQIAVKNGFVGTEVEWLKKLELTFEDLTPANIATLKGAKGDTGGVGIKGSDGLKGDTGREGKSAHEVYVASVVEGTPLSQADWLASLKGATGSKGDTGDKGDKGDVGPAGDIGVTGKSAYQSYVDTTADEEVLSEIEWISSLHGKDGANGDTGIDGVTQDATTILMTGMSTSTTDPVDVVDTLLIAVGKLQAQITALETRIAALDAPQEA